LNEFEQTNINEALKWLNTKRKINEALVLFSYFYGTKFLKCLLRRTNQRRSVYDVTVQGGSGREVPK
jgi:hypothetical protein